MLKSNTQLMEVPDWNFGEINYLLDIKTIINGVCRETTVYPPIIKMGNRRFISACNKLFIKFIFCSHNGKGKAIIIDPLECLKNIMKMYSNLNWNKFIIISDERLTPSYLPINRWLEEWYYDVKYWKVREQIISYIEQKIGRDCKGLDELKDLFASKNTMDFSEYINKKSKMLNEMDLSNYISGLNKETIRKQNVKR